jgi:Dolichyl-phosphate-mannose-protein mannosyltransferase
VGTVTESIPPAADLRGRSTRLASGDRRNVLLAVSLGLAIRLALIVAYKPALAPDSASYLELARRIGAMSLGGYSGERTPGYPLLLAVVHYSPTAAWCAQAFLGLVATALVYMLVRMLGGSSTTALVASLLYTSSLEVLAAEHYVLTETLDSFLLTAAAAECVALVISQTPRRRLLLLTGATLSLLCLVRPDGLLVVVSLVAGALVLRRRDRSSAHTDAQWWRRCTLRHGLALLLPPIIALGAWAAINKINTGVTSATPVTGYNLIDHVAPEVSVDSQGDRIDTALAAVYVRWRSRQEAATGSYFETSWLARADMVRISHLDLAHLGQRLQAIALRVSTQHPLQYLWLSVKYWPDFWRTYNATFGSYGSASVIGRIWPLSRWIKMFVAALFLISCAAHAVRVIAKRSPFLSPSSVMLAVAVLAGTIPLTLFGDGEEGRLGFVYFPLYLSIAMVSGARFTRALWSHDSPAAGRGSFRVPYQAARPRLLRRRRAADAAQSHSPTPK